MTDVYVDKKEEARKFLDQIKSGDGTVSKSDLAKKIGVSVETCHNWIKKYYPEEFMDIRTHRDHKINQPKTRRLRKIVKSVPRAAPQLLKLSLPETKINQPLIKSLLQNAIMNLQTISELMKEFRG
jgi:transposase